jgi:glycosyltransferase 2 family protein
MSASNTLKSAPISLPQDGGHGRPATAAANAGAMRLGRSLAWPLLMGLLGLCLLPMLTQWRDVRYAVAQLGLLLLPLAALHALPILLDSRGWRALLRRLDPARGPSASYLWGAALVREAISNCTPLSGMGAFLAAVRLLNLKGVGPATAVASVVAESTLTLLTQMSLMLAAVAAWLLIMPAGAARHSHLLLPLMLCLLLLAGMVFLQSSRHARNLFSGILRRLRQAPRVVAMSDGLGAVYLALNRIYAQPRACLRAAAWQLAALAAAVAELWLMLSLLQCPRAALLALALSSVARLARSLAVLPAGLGLQELAFGGLMLGAGQDFGAGVAISLATRARDLLFGAPVLLGWLWLEHSHHGRGKALSEAVRADDTTLSPALPAMQESAT